MTSKAKNKSRNNTQPQAQTITLNQPNSAEELKILPDTYIFTVVTMGGVGQGSVSSLRKVLAEKGLKLIYGKGIHMPPNYVIKYNPADSIKATKTLHNVKERLRVIADEIKLGTQSVKSLPVTANNLFKNIDHLDTEFAANTDCTDCGLCEKICPVGNIRIDNGKPTWLGHCEHCVACISWCPAKAINYGNKTQTRRRYRNPRIKSDELIV